METGGIIAIVFGAIFFIAFGIVMYKIFSENKKKEFEKKTSAKGGVQKNLIQDRKNEILASIDPNDPEDAKKKLEIVDKLEKMSKK